MVFRRSGQSEDLGEEVVEELQSHRCRDKMALGNKTLEVWFVLSCFALLASDGQAAEAQDQAAQHSCHRRSRAQLPSRWHGSQYFEAWLKTIRPVNLYLTKQY